MKKRTLLNRKNALKICVCSLFTCAYLSTNAGLQCQPKLEDSYYRQTHITAATDVRISLQNPIAKPGFPQRDTRVWVPIELAPSDGHCNPVAADYSIRNTSYPLILKIPESTVLVDIPEPEPMPVLLYILFIAAFGMVGFFTPATSPARLIRRCGWGLSLWNH